MRSDKFGSQLDWKSKTWFFTFLNVYVFWIEWDKILILQFSPSQFRYFTDQNGPKELGDHMKTNFDIFQIQKRISQTVRSQKVDEKKGVICQVFFFSSWVMVLKLTKIVHFLQICADLSKKSKSIAAFIYIYLKDLIMLFQKIVCFIGVWTTVHKILGNKTSKKVLNQQKFNEIHHLQMLISSKLYVVA